ncbi:hypothetical protein AB0K15_32585 [Amycolatopsis sp. NPDC049253]|uniref:hypothetical protein n=1 Tax=Amycolatopsis sp. NPDC049253 TaxID=3155274 RepID=UPI00341E9F20
MSTPRFPRSVEGSAAGIGDQAVECAGQLDCRGHFAIAAAFDVIAGAFADLLADQAHLGDTISSGR